MNSLLPVARDRDWSVDRSRLNSSLHWDGKRLALHHGQGLPGALVEGRGGVVKIFCFSCSLLRLGSKDGGSGVSALRGQEQEPSSSGEHDDDAEVPAGLLAEDHSVHPPRHVAELGNKRGLRCPR